jgi:predicted O-linked N-acetylglucosamine transferase (SPINDLY family)
MLINIADELTEGIRRQEAGDLAAARDHFCAVLRRQPTHPRAWHLLGLTAYQAGEAAMALDCLERAWPGNRDNADFHTDLARAQRAAGDLKAAAASLREAVRLRPDDPAPRTELGEVLLHACLIDEARAALREALDLDPDHVPALVQMTSLLLTLGEWRQAEEASRRAVRLRPDLAQAHHDLGVALMEQGRTDEAEANYRQALLLKPNFPDALNHLGMLLQRQKRLEEALACYAQAQRFWPDKAEVFNNIGGVLLLLGRAGEAIPHLEQAVRRQPHRVELLTNLGMALLLQGRVEEAMTYHRRARRRPEIPAAPYEDLLLAANFDPDLDPGCLLEEHVRWAKVHAPRVAVAPHGNDPDPDRPLRVGYVSPDLRWHAVARFFEPILASHDPRRVEAYCYAEVAAPDHVTRRLQELAKGWRFTCGMSDAALAEAIRADGIDILVDLAGHTANSRLLAFAHRPAPVQVSYLGYPNTTGLPAIDYRLTDAVADPPGGPRRYTEELVYLPEGFCCFGLPADAPDVAPLPALRNGYVTFGSPHNLVKLNGRALDLWARVLSAVPGSRLFAFRSGLDGSVRDRLVSEFARRGVTADRLAWRDVPMMELGERGYLELYAEADICLDSFPATAHTTACEALCMGVPLVTLYGDRTWGRLSASVLGRLGMADWVARTPDEYVAIAAQKAADLPALAELRSGLRAALAAGLGDGPRFTRALEDAYRSLWRRWCHQGRP